MEKQDSGRSIFVCLCLSEKKIFLCTCIMLCVCVPVENNNKIRIYFLHLKREVEKKENRKNPSKNIYNTYFNKTT